MKRPVEVLRDVENQIDAEIMVQVAHYRTIENDEMNIDKAIVASKISGKLEELKSIKDFIGTIKPYSN